MNAFWTSLTAWLIHSALGAGLLLLLTCAVMGMVRQPARRQRLGELGTLAALLLAGLCLAPGWLIVEWPHALPPAKMPGEVIAPRADIEPPVLAIIIEEIPNEPSPAGEIASEAPVNPRLHRMATLVPLLFLAGAGFSAARWLVGWFGLCWLLVHARRPPDWALRVFHEHFAGLNGVRLLMSQRLSAPISCGLFRPTIVLPASLCSSCDAGKLRWIFAHELTHLRRRDPWSSLLFALGQLVFFYLPWFYWIRRQAGLCQEYVADAAAIDAVDGGTAADYAEFLLSLTKGPAVPLGAAGVTGHRSDLYRRLTMLLQNPFHIEQSCPRSWLLTAGGLLLSAAVVLSGLGLSSETAGAAPQDEQAAPKAPSVAPAKPATPATPAGDDDPLEQIRQAIRDLDSDASKAELERARKQIQEALERLRSRGPRGGASIDIDIKPFGTLPKEAEEQIRKAQEMVQARIRGLGQPPGFEIRRFPFERGRLGLAVDRPSQLIADQLDLPKGQGLVVIDVVDNSPADKAGIKVNDILLELNKQPVKNEPGELARMVADIKGEASVDVLLLRKGKRMTVKDIKLPEAQKTESAWPAFRDFPMLPFRGGPGAVMSTVMRNKDEFATHHHEGKLMIRVTGKIDDGKAKVERITIQDGRPPQNYDKVEDVPQEYRERVNQAIELSRSAANRGDKK